MHPSLPRVAGWLIHPAVTKIKCAPKGPYLLEGPLEIEGPDGTVHSVDAGKKAALCRCGASMKKPFCDGTHSKIGFEAAETAAGTN